MLYQRSATYWFPWMMCWGQTWYLLLLDSPHRMTYNVTSSLYQHGMVNWEYKFPPRMLIENCSHLKKSPYPSRITFLIRTESMVMTSSMINYKTRPMSARTTKRGTKRKQIRSTDNRQSGPNPTRLLQLQCESSVMRLQGGREIDFRELVYLMNGTLLRVALIWYPAANAPQKSILARSHY